MLRDQAETTNRNSDDISAKIKCEQENSIHGLETMRKALAGGIRMVGTEKF